MRLDIDRNPSVACSHFQARSGGTVQADTFLKVCSLSTDIAQRCAYVCSQVADFRIPGVQLNRHLRIL
jgi:hypothetical protein